MKGTMGLSEIREKIENVKYPPVCVGILPAPCPLVQAKQNPSV